MSLIIKGMSLPSECSECLFSCYDVSVCAPAECIILGERSARHCRPKICPLVEIPTPHGDLIDKEPIKKFISDGINKPAPESYGYDGIEILSEIEFAPVIIEAEVSK